MPALTSDCLTGGWPPGVCEESRSVAAEAPRRCASCCRSMVDASAWEVPVFWKELPAWPGLVVAGNVDNVGGFDEKFTFMSAGTAAPTLVVQWPPVLVTGMDTSMLLRGCSLSVTLLGTFVEYSFVE